MLPVVFPSSVIYSKKGCEVVLAADGASLGLLEAEFSGIRVIQLDGYGIRYGTGTSLFGSMLLQPHIFSSIRNEQHWLNELLQKERFDAVISDNRPGLWNKKTHCIYITHQLLIHSGKGKMAELYPAKIAYPLHAKKFSEVWVPDMPSVKNLAGELSHPPHPGIQPPTWDCFKVRKEYN